MVHGMVVSALRTYRRCVFDRVGGFDERLGWAVDYEMALRVGQHYTFARVPEMLYGRRIHRAGVSQGFQVKALRQWWMRQALVRQKLRKGKGRLLGYGTLVTNGRLLIGLAHAGRGLMKSGSNP